MKHVVVMQVMNIQPVAATTYHTLVAIPLPDTPFDSQPFCAQAIVLKLAYFRIPA